jgi:hypothetical protein
MRIERTAELQIAGLAVLALGLVAIGVWIVMRVKNNPEKRERERRRVLGERGRFGDALISEVNEGFIYYTYSVHGVQYTASQDVTSLAAYLPTHPDRLIGPASIKYASNNPGNSILLCEEWSGLRRFVSRSSNADDELSADSLTSDPLLSNDDPVGHQA